MVDSPFFNACRAAMAARPTARYTGLWASPDITAQTERGFEPVQQFATLRGETRDEVERNVAALREDFSERHARRLNPDGLTFSLWEDGRWTDRAEALAQSLGVALP